MSMFADITSVFREAAKSGMIDRDQATDLFVDVIGALEWDSFDFDYSIDYEEALEKESVKAYETLFGIEDGPSEEDGPWAEGWEERCG